jgi:hypothetical protein
MSRGMVTLESEGTDKLLAELCSGKFNVADCRDPE